MQTFDPERFGPHEQNLDDLYIPNFRPETLDSRVYGLDTSAIAYKHATTVENVERCIVLAQRLLERLDELGYGPEPPTCRTHLYEDVLGAYTESVVSASAVLWNKLMFDLPRDQTKRSDLVLVVEHQAGQFTGQWNIENGPQRELMGYVMSAADFGIKTSQGDSRLFKRAVDKIEFTHLLLHSLFESEPPLRGFNLISANNREAQLSFGWRPGPGAFDRGSKQQTY